MSKIIFPIFSSLTPSTWAFLSVQFVNNKLSNFSLISDTLKNTFGKFRNVLSDFLPEKLFLSWKVARKYSAIINACVYMNKIILTKDTFTTYQLPLSYRAVLCIYLPLSLKTNTRNRSSRIYSTQ